MTLLILFLMAGRIIAMILAADVIYRQAQLRRRPVDPRLVKFRERAFQGSLAVFALNIVPSFSNLIYLTNPYIEPITDTKLGTIYALSFVALSLALAYITNDIYRNSDGTESLANLIKRKLRK